MRDKIIWFGIVGFVGFMIYIYVVSIKKRNAFCKANPNSKKCMPAEPSKDETCIITDSCIIDAVIINEMMY